MKNKDYIFTKSRMGLDNGVWLSMIIALLISIFIFGFKTITKKPCVSLEISANIKQDTGSVFYSGDPITFSIPVQPQDKLEWNFGDNTSVQTGNFPQHVFTRDDDFSIVCIVNNSCKYVASVKIITPPFKQFDTALYIGNSINGPDSVYVGSPVMYSTKIKAKNSYQWSVINQDNSIQIKDTAFITFKEAGSQTVQLKIDGNKNYYKQIVVQLNKLLNKNASNGAVVSTYKFPPVINSINPPNGEINTPLTISGSFFKGVKSVKIGNVNVNFYVVSNNEITATIVDGASGFVTVETDDGIVTFSNQAFTYIPPKVIQSTSGPIKEDKPTHVSINDNNLNKLLTKVINGQADAKTIASYFCLGEGTPVTINNKTLITLSELCKRLQENKQIKIETAHVVPDPNNPNCESNLAVNYSEPKKIFGIKVGKKHE